MVTDADDEIGDVTALESRTFPEGKVGSSDPPAL